MHILLVAVQAIGLTLAADSGVLSEPLTLAPAPETSAREPELAQPSAQPEKPAEKQPEKPAEKKNTDPKEPPADPSTEDVLKDMEKQRGNVPPPTPSTAPPVQQPQQPAANPARPVAAGRLLREGTFLVNRRGRMVRSSSGDWTFAFDADAQNQADPTMVLMPCQKLEAMEKLAERYGESLTFSLTGQVFVYKNRNYLLPGPFRVERANEDLKTNQ